MIMILLLIIIIIIIIVFLIGYPPPNPPLLFLTYAYASCWQDPFLRANPLKNHHLFQEFSLKINHVMLFLPKLVQRIGGGAL